MDAPNPDEVWDIEGPADETLFRRAIAWLARPEAQRVQEDLDALWAHYRELSDPRLISLVGAMSMEASLDAVLLGIAPGYNALTRDSNLTLSVKIKFVRALRLLPSRILGTCDLIRQIRNEFAHSIDVRTMEDLPQKLARKIEPHLAEFTSADHRGTSEAEKLKLLVSVTLAALSVYATQVAAARQFMSDDVFWGAFQTWADGSA